MADVFSELLASLQMKDSVLENIAEQLQELDIGGAEHTKRNILTDITEDGADYTFSYLPEHNAETMLSRTYTVNSFEIEQFRISQTETAPDDYTAVLLLKKGADVETLNDLIVNSQSGYTGTAIHLLNPDLDISTYSIIHVMIFFDGFNYCALCAGYQVQ